VLSDIRGQVSVLCSLAIVYALAAVLLAARSRSRLAEMTPDLAR